MSLPAAAMAPDSGERNPILMGPARAPSPRPTTRRRPPAACTAPAWPCEPSPSVEPVWVVIVTDGEGRSARRERGRAAPPSPSDHTAGLIAARAEAVVPAAVVVAAAVVAVVAVLVVLLVLPLAAGAV